VFAFSHCRDVVAAVSRAGGYGVLGAVLMTPEQRDVELTWIDEHAGGRPYGFDLMVPAALSSTEAASTFHPANVTIPEGHPRYRDVALQHGATMVANALGTLPPVMVEKAQTAGAVVAALVGTRKHAHAQLDDGVDVPVAQGYEAGGHTGEVATMVLVPEIVETVRAARKTTPVLAAGGIVTGREVAASIALGAAGVWCGSVWLTSREAETPEHLKANKLAATSSDTVRSRYRTGKPSRQLPSSWHDAWERPGAPAALSMPLMGHLSEPALGRASALAESGNEQAIRLNTYWVGQGVGSRNKAKPVRQIMADIADVYLQAVSDLKESIDE
jgi:NAD(P)H-dependent flavin oxidoreductase YrpB (nitropropane dioxygenase family)